MSGPNPYQPGGTLGGISYVTRIADERLQKAILDNKLFPFFLAARQSGKSSVLAHTKAVLSSPQLRIIIIDLSEFSAVALQKYQRFVIEFVDEILEQIDADPLLRAVVQKATERPRFLLQTIRAVLTHVDGRLIVCIDEVDVLTRCVFKDEFLSQVRALFNRRTTEQLLKRIQFVLAGAASCEALITDIRRSPFNVGEDIGLDDLTSEGVKNLVLLGWPAKEPELDDATRTLLFWTGGAAYLCQHILHRTYEEYNGKPYSLSLTIELERSISRVIEEAGRTAHFVNIARLLKSNTGLLKKWRNWHEGEFPDDITVGELSIIGICRRDGPFRNKLYQSIFGHRGPLSLLYSPALTFEYDVFLSHSSEDKSAVREIAKRLRDAGLRVWFDEWEIKPGHSIAAKIEEGLEQTRTMALCMSKSGFASDWISLERQTSLFRDPTNARRRFIPIRLDDSAIPLKLRQFSYIDWRAKSASEFERLVAACRSQIDISDHRLSDTVHFAGAKVLLLGDSGAGKTALATRLGSDEWRPSESTVGPWVTQWKLPFSNDDTEREISLWDFGGQLDQRLIHQLYMHDTALAVLVFDGQREDVLESLTQWDQEITRVLPNPSTKLLVAARVDVGGLRISRRQIEVFMKKRGYAQFLETSAMTGLGCEELRQAIINGIQWENISWTSTPLIFKRLKEEIIRLKAGGHVLMRFNELRESLELRLSGEEGRFSDRDLGTVIGILAGAGTVWDLTFGSWVLLQPELISAYAQAVIQTLRSDEQEKGTIPEARVLSGDLTYPSSMRRLELEEERFVLLAMHQALIERGVCLRENTETGPLLIFPSYYRCERPELVAHPAVLVSYRFSGFLDDIYAKLVVDLHHTRFFEQDQLWRYAADFKTLNGKKLGMKLSRRTEGVGELEIYFELGIPVEEKIIFTRFVDEQLRQKAENVVRLRHYICPHCGTSVGNREVVMERLESWLERKTTDRAVGRPPKSWLNKAKLPTIICSKCEERVPLWDELEQCFASLEMQQRVRELQEQSAIVLDNESKERALVGEVISTVALAGQICREFNVSDHGIDMEIEFKSEMGEATGRKLYLQLKSGDSYLRQRQRDDKEVFTIKDERHTQYWMEQAFPVMLVMRTSDGEIRWMEVRDWLKRASDMGEKPVKQIIFQGNRFDVMSVRTWRDKLLGQGLR